ncbi:hypothetical protein [Demequina sediminicola]|uniref:hypothetical protein n=1 Tax=Demequina sediminicola TaxID=1095026 RepID=UPI0007860366|nr:hypothetical protein [Demequina sediminicola]
MTTVAILSAMELRRSSALQTYVDQFREAGADEVTIITLGPLTHWREDDPKPLVLDAGVAARRRSRRPWNKAKAERLTLRGPRWRMARLLKSNAAARRIIDDADYVYVDQPAAVLGAWKLAQKRKSTPFVTSPTRVIRLLENQ